MHPRVGVYRPGSPPTTGGEIYLSQVIAALEGPYEVQEILLRGRRRVQQWLTCPDLPRGFDATIESPVSVAAPGRRSAGKRILLLHHLSRVNLQDQTVGRVMETVMFRRLPRLDRLVVVSEYWKRWFRERFEVPVRVIHNGFRITGYSLTPFDETAFRRRLGLDDRPIVYLGPRRKEKGVVEVADRLAHRKELQLVTSGPDLTGARTRHIDCSQQDYRRLLKIASVTVQMPTYPEGWNRLVHESLLVGTPVIGNGSGGMAELLQGAGQPICPDIQDLEARVLDAVHSDRTLPSENRAFLEGFTMERLKASWLSLLDDLLG